MATSWDSVPIKILLDSDGARPLAVRATFGSSRHVANSNHDLTQYTGVGDKTFTFNLLLDADDYEDIMDGYEAIPRTSEELLIDGSDQGDYFIDAVSEARVLYTGEVFVTVVFREDV